MPVLSLCNNHYTSSAHSYFLYGHSIRSAWPLPYLAEVETHAVDFEFISDDAPFHSEEIEGILGCLDDTAWFHHTRLSDGSDFIRWTGLFDFLVSANGRKITGRCFTAHPLESFQTYLLGQVLSVAMVRRGIEPLHSTVVVIDGRAVAFLGNCGYGKSTLAGAFIQAGFQILTDDMLILRQERGNLVAYPGPPRIKLFPEIVKTLIMEDVVGTPMNPGTTKLVVPLPTKYYAQTPTVLKLFYALQPPDNPSKQVTISPLPRSQALLSLVQNTYNTIVKSPERLTQQFHFAAELSGSVPVRSLAYPRKLSWLGKVIDAVLRDIG